MHHVHDMWGKISPLRGSLRFFLLTLSRTARNIAIEKTVKWRNSINYANNFYKPTSILHSRLQDKNVANFPRIYFLINFLRSIKRVLVREFTALSGIEAEFYRTAINSRLRA